VFIKEVRDRVARIADIASDDAKAHSNEDDLYIDVLKAIANHKGGNPARLAQEALKTQSIEFSRWCA